MNETVGECRLEYNPIARITVRRSAAITNTSVRRGEWDLTGTYAANDYTSASASWSGSFTATQHGAAFHRRSSTNEPRLMVSTDGVGDIPIQGNNDYTNRFGIAVVPFVSSYQPTTVAVNMNDLPDGVTVSENVVKETWTEGAIGFKSLASRAGKDLNVIISDANGHFPPLGADVRQAEGGVSVGMVGENGHAWLSGVDENQQFTVHWGDQKTCAIHLPEHLEDVTNRLIFTLSLIKEKTMTFVKGFPLILLVASMCSHGAVQPDRTRIIFNSKDKATSLRVENRSEKLPLPRLFMDRK